MKDNKDLKALLSATRGMKVPVGDLIKNHRQELAVVSKLVKDRDPQLLDNKDASTYSNLDHSHLKQISDLVSKSARDSENVMGLFPDMRLSEQILISSILSPKDMVSTELKYKLKEQYLSSEITSALLDILKTHLEVHYRLKEKLPTMLSEILIRRGSYVLAVIPESSVDDIINTGNISTEGLKELFGKGEEVKSIGILGSPGKDEDTRFTKETLRAFNKRFGENNGRIAVETNDQSMIDLGIEVSDNFTFLKMPEILSSVAKRKVTDIIRNKTRRVATEDRNSSTHELESDVIDRVSGKLLGDEKLNAQQIENKLFKNAMSDVKQFTRVKTRRTASRKSIGRPLLLKLPPESVIPVYSPGDEQDHVGYFVLVDEYGSPVKADPNDDYPNEIANSLGDQNNSLSSFLLQKASRNLRDDRVNTTTVRQAVKIYGELVSQDITERLKNGIYGANLSVSQISAVYEIMLHRTFHNRLTKLVYIPAELVTYMAYQYRENGTGESLNDDLQVINALSAVTTLARVLASVKNSIGVTNAHLKLDPDDPDPNKSIEIAMHELVRTRQLNFPFGVNSPSDLVDWIQRAQMQFSFEGHADIPDLTMEVTQSNANHTKPDDELDEDLRKRRIMGLGLSPETVDNGFASEFATTVVANNLLLSKRVIQIQDAFTPKLAHHARCLIMNDMVLREELLDILRENIEAIRRYWSSENKLMLRKEEDEQNDEQMLEEILDGFSSRVEINLPKPDTTTLVNQKMALDTYIEFLDAALDNAYFPSEILGNEIAGELGNNADQIKSIYRSYLIRNYMAVNNMLPEISDITTTDEEGRPKVDVFEIQKEHIVGITRSALKFYDSMQDIISAINVDVENTKSLSGSTGSDYSSSDDEDSSEEGESDDDEFGFGGDDAFGEDDGETSEGDGDEDTGDEDKPDDTQDDAGGKDYAV